MNDIFNRRDSRLDNGRADFGALTPSVHFVEKQEFQHARGKRVADSTSLLVGGLESSGNSHSLWRTTILGNQPPSQVFAGAADGRVSPNGKYYAVIGEDQKEIILTASDRSETRTLISGRVISEVFWSSDSARVYFSEKDRGSNRIASIAVRGGKEELLREIPSLESAVLLHPDRFLYSVNVWPGTEMYQLKFDRNTGKESDAPALLQRVEAFSLNHLSSSVDGEKVAYLQGEPLAATWTGDLVDGNMRLENQRRLTLQDYDAYPHGWTPDSRFVLFETARFSKKWSIYKQEPGSPEAQPLLLNRPPAIRATAAPGGGALLFEALPHFIVNVIDSERNIMRLPVGGGPPVELYSFKSQGSFRCPYAPGRPCVIAEESHHGTVFSYLDPVRGTTTKWKDYLPEVRAIDWDLSPDGATVALLCRGGNDNRILLISDKGASDEFVVSSARSLRSVNWWPNGGGFFCSREDRGTVSLLSISRGHNVAVLEKDAGGLPTWAVPSPGGHKLAYVSHVQHIFRRIHSRKDLRISILQILLGLAAAGFIPVMAQSTSAPRASVAGTSESIALSPRYKALQQRLARGWNTWDVNSVLTHVLLPEGLAIHLSLKHNSSLEGDALLTDALIGRLSQGAERIFPGPHAWDGSYTDARVVWKGHDWRVQSAHDGQDLILLATPLPSESKEPLAPTIIFSVNFLWNKTGSATKLRGVIETRAPAGAVRVYCTCEPETGIANTRKVISISPLTGPYFAADFTSPVGLGTGKRRSLAEIQDTLERRRTLYDRSFQGKTESKPIADAIETTLGWDTIFEPEKQRVVSPVSRGWSVRWGGYVIFDWDTFFAATLASVGDRDLAYADAVETLRESTTAGFVPNYARAGNWKSFDRSEPPVGSITVLGLYRKFGEKWLLSQCFPALLQWNRWWAQHRDIQGYLTWGSDGENPPGNLDDVTRGTRAGAILESGLDNSPMYDDATFDAGTHLLQFADVGLMGLYIADCDALANIADELHKTANAREIRIRGQAYREKLQTLWSADSGIFLNKDLRTGKFSPRLSPTNFYPMLAHAATASQAQEMVSKHLMNPAEFWGEWVIPSIARDDPAFKDQNYWRGRIWGPMNYLVYLGLKNYDLSKVRAEFAAKSYSLFLREWREHGHVHENYNAILGSGDDVSSSDRFYHWGALLGFAEYLEENERGTIQK